MEDRASAAEDRRQAADERERLESQLERAQLDDLTGFYLRGLGKAMLQREIDRSRRSEGRMVLAYIDVDGLKQVNDEHGHDAGDRLLVNVADAIRSRLRSYDPVVRMGGDEFVFVVSETDLDATHSVVKAIRGALTERQAGRLDHGRARGPGGRRFARDPVRPRRRRASRSQGPCSADRSRSAGVVKVVARAGFGDLAVSQDDRDLRAHLRQASRKNGVRYSIAITWFPWTRR